MRTPIKILGATFATIASIVLVITVYWSVLPAIKEHLIRSFCESVNVGDRAEDVWDRGRWFDRERGASNMDFSVTLPSLFIAVWHCNVAVDESGRVSNKVFGRED